MRKPQQVPGKMRRMRWKTSQESHDARNRKRVGKMGSQAAENWSRNRTTTCQICPLSTRKRPALSTHTCHNFLYQRRLEKWSGKTGAAELPKTSSYASEQVSPSLPIDRCFSSIQLLACPLSTFCLLHHKTTLTIFHGTSVCLPSSSSSFSRAALQVSSVAPPRPSVRETADLLLGAPGGPTSLVLSG